MVSLRLGTELPWAPHVSSEEEGGHWENMCLIIQLLCCRPCAAAACPSLQE
jgi:hypothetical protein